MKITEELINKLSDEGITRKEYKNIQSLVDERVDDIWRELCRLTDRKIDWWAFSNDRSLGPGNGSTGGHFDPNTDSEWIEIIGDFPNCKYDDLYDNGFPTSFLWTDNWEQEVHDHYSKCIKLSKEKKQSDREKRLAKKEDKARMKELIQSKLTKEELKYIRFK